MKKSLLSVALGFAALGAFNAQANLDQHVKNVEQQVIEWRRDFHQNPKTPKPQNPVRSSFCIKNCQFWQEFLQ